MGIFTEKIIEISEENLEKELSNINVTTNIQQSILLELNRRNLKYLKKSIDKFSFSSDKTSEKMIGLTKWLIGLTVVLVMLTIILAIPIVRIYFK